MDCKIRSYNAVRAKIFGKKLTALQWLILRRSWPHTHDEFQFSKRHGNISFSATLMEGSKGARFKDIKYSNLQRWDDVTISMTDEQEDTAYKRAQELAGTPYDTIGQLSHLFKLKIWRPSKKKIWCSKAVGELLYAAFPVFFMWFQYHLDTTELRPDQLEMMARHYFRKGSYP